MTLQGTIRRVNEYADGIPSLEINFHKKHESDLPVTKNKATPIHLQLGEQTYDAKLCHTDNCDVIWISPKCVLNDERIRLADILISSGFGNKDIISIEFTGNKATILAKSN